MIYEEKREYASNNANGCEYKKPFKGFFIALIGRDWNQFIGNIKELFELLKEINPALAQG
ncbi:MAG: hypothetical protein HY001_00905 [Candidatus Portnoybacteria bacterium]|nr:hypothetical protein [Candidatus Portnoybacteria bacterium]